MHAEKLFTKLREHAPGLILAGIFFLILTFLAFRLNDPGLDTTDNYLDADNSTWMRRIAWADGYHFEMRAPHPFAYLIFRPLGWLFNLFLPEPYLSALYLNTIAGAASVFLAWLFVYTRFQNNTYAFLFAALLGTTTSQLWFGAVVETYIFSAAALLLFFVLLQRKNGALIPPLAASLVSFGLTITNVVQTFIGFFIDRPNLKKFIFFASAVVAVGVILNLVQALIYPSASIIFLPNATQAEREFTINIFQEPGWRAFGRIVLLVRTILLYTVIAPRPFVFGAEVGGTFPSFNFFRIAPGEFAFSAYDGLGNVLVFTWAAILAVAGFLFLRNMIRERRLDLSFAFVLCLLFNFLLHLNYGYEPFLYSPDWAYALVLFVALSLGGYSSNRLLQALLSAFLILLVINQWQFFEFVFETITPYLN